MSPVRTPGRLFDAFVGHIDGRRARLCRNGWPLVLALILVVTVPLDYAGPADPTGITPIYDAVECDDTADVNHDRVITHGQPVGEPVPTVAGDPGSVVVPPVATSVNVAVSTMAAVVCRVRPPPRRCDHGCALSPPLLPLLGPWPRFVFQPFSEFAHTNRDDTDARSSCLSVRGRSSGDARVGQAALLIAPSIPGSVRRSRAAESSEPSPLAALRLMHPPARLLPCDATQRRRCRNQQIRSHQRRTTWPMQ
jgi:hypothetical protein